MSTIWKFPLAITDEQNVTMPRGSEVLSTAMQGDQLCIWALVPLNQDEEEVHTIAILGTGHARNDLAGSDVSFIGTVMLHGGAMVFHVFDLGVSS